MASPVPAVDPFAVEVRPAHPPRWDDVAGVLDTRGDSRRCWCQWFRQSTSGWQTTDAAGHRAALQRQVLDDPHPPGVIGYLKGEPAAWCAIAPRSTYPRLHRSRKLVAAGVHADLDDESIWAVTCFVVRAEHRGRGLTGLLLSGAVAFAAERGARVIEGYPVDLSRRDRIGSAELFVGTLSTFLAAGFTEVGRSAPPRPVVRLVLAPGGATTDG